MNQQFHLEATACLDRDTKVREVRSVIIDAPTTRRHRLSNTEISHQSFVHVQVTLENGVIGHGEASTLGGPRWAEESVEAIKANIDTYLAPALIGHPASHVEAASLRMAKASKRNYSAKAALDAALVDALGRTLNLPASVLMGGAVRDRISVIWALASGDAEQECEEARAKIAARQFNRFKIKLGFAEPALDLARIRALRDALPEAELVVDVNQAWSEAQAIRFLPALEELNITLVEQPIAASQLEGMARIAARTRIPVMLDECCFTSEETFRAASCGAGTVLSLKLVKSGGMHEMKRAAGIASAAGIELYGGCLLESSLGAAAHLAVFSTLPALEWGCEHFGPQIMVQDTVSDPLVFEDFHVMVPQGPGLGVTPDQDRIREMARA